MTTVFKVITLIFGLFWLIFGLNNFLNFFPIPEPSETGAAFMGALKQAGYVLPIVYATQVICGALLILRKFIALSLVLIAPVTFNIILYDLFLNPSGLVIGLVITVLHAALLFDQRQKFIPLIQP